MTESKERDIIYGTLMDMWLRRECVDTSLLLCPPTINVKEIDGDDNNPYLEFLRSTQPICNDFTLEPNVLPVHRCILYAHSRYVSLLAKYSSPQTSHPWQIDLRSCGISHDIMWAILYFLYTGVLHIKYDNFSAIKECSDYLQIEKALQECGTFVLDNCRPEHSLYFWCHCHSSGIQQNVMSHIRCMVGRCIAQYPASLLGTCKNLFSALLALEEIICEGALLVTSGCKEGAFLTNAAYWWRLKQLFLQWLGEVYVEDSNASSENYYDSSCLEAKLSTWEKSYPHLPCSELDRERLYIYPPEDRFPPSTMNSHARSKGTFKTLLATFDSTTNLLLDLRLEFDDVDEVDSVPSESSSQLDHVIVCIPLKEHEVITIVEVTSLTPLDQVHNLISIKLHTSLQRILHLVNPSISSSMENGIDIQLFGTTFTQTTSLTDVRKLVSCSAAHLHSLWFVNGRLYLIWASLDETWMLKTFSPISYHVGLPDNGQLKNQRRHRLPC